MNDSFDKKIKEVLENFEMPYDANAWAEMEKQLPKQKSAATNSGASGWKLIAAAAVIASAAALFWFTQQDEQLQPENELTTETEMHSGPTEESEKQVSLEDSEVPVSSIEKNSVAQDKTSGTNVVSNKEEFSKTVDKAAREPKVEIAELHETTQTESTVPETTGTDFEQNSEIAEKNPEQVLQVDVELSATKICANQDVNFISESNLKNVQYEWDFGDGTTSNDQSPTHSFVNSGTYTVMMTASLGSQTKHKEYKLAVNPSPTPVLSAERKLNGYQAIPLYIFTTATQPSETAIWTFTDGSTNSGNSALHLFRSGGIQTATLSVTNNFGCSMSIDRKYELEKFNLLAPTAFTPDGDGMNETFIPKALPEMGLSFEMTIRDPKTGQIVYRTEDPTAPWNGTLNNSGVKLDNGIYIWSVVLKDNVVKNRVFTETINLQR